MIKQLAIRVQVADDHPVVRDGLTATINYQPDMNVVAKSANGLEAVEHFRKFKPDVTLMDLRMPEMDGVTAITAIRAEFPDAVIMVLTTYDGDEEIFKGLGAGAAGYLLKDTPMEDVLMTIRRVYKKKLQVPRDAAIRDARRAIGAEMSERELEVLSLISRGYNNQAICSSLFIADSAVKKHVASICSKLATGERPRRAAKPSNSGFPRGA
jgi:DNA-binding NarL/FixJ family response regulator